MTTKFHKENQEARIAAEAAYEDWRESISDALRLARQCKGEDVDPMVKALASSAGFTAAEKRKAVKELAVKAASARRLACRVAMGDKPIPPMARNLINGGKMPKPPNRQ